MRNIEIKIFIEAGLREREQLKTIVAHPVLWRVQWDTALMSVLHGDSKAIGSKMLLLEIHREVQI